MTDIKKQLQQIAMRKRDEKGEEGVIVSEKSFVEWQAAVEIERLQANLEHYESALCDIEVYRTALEFYANERHYRGKTAEIHRDLGRAAREVLRDE